MNSIVISAFFLQKDKTNKTLLDFSTVVHFLHRWLSQRSAENHRRWPATSIPGWNNDGSRRKHQMPIQGRPVVSTSHAVILNPTNNFKSSFFAYYVHCLFFFKKECILHQCPKSVPSWYSKCKGDITDSWEIVGINRIQPIFCEH